MTIAGTHYFCQLWKICNDFAISKTYVMQCLIRNLLNCKAIAIEDVKPSLLLRIDWLTNQNTWSHTNLSLLLNDKLCLYYLYNFACCVWLKNSSPSLRSIKVLKYPQGKPLQKWIDRRQKDWVPVTLDIADFKLNYSSTQ